MGFLEGKWLGKQRRTKVDWLQGKKEGLLKWELVVSLGSQLCQMMF